MFCDVMLCRSYSVLYNFVEICCDNEVFGKNQKADNFVGHSKQTLCDT